MSFFLNPDTYTRKSLLEFRALILKDRVRVYGTIILMGVLYFTIIPILLQKNNAYKERVPILSGIADSEQGAGSQIEEGREGGNGQEIEGFLIKHQQI